MFEKVLACLDGSNLSEQILPYASEQALKFNSQLVLLKVITSQINVPPPEWPTRPGYLFPTAISTDEYVSAEMQLIQKKQEQATSYLEEKAQSLKSKKIKVATTVIQGDPAQAIINYAEDSNVDLIALSTRGHSGLGRAVFGSVADYVLRQSKLPVLVIKPKESYK